MIRCVLLQHSDLEFASGQVLEENPPTTQVERPARAATSSFKLIHASYRRIANSAGLPETIRETHKTNHPHCSEHVDESLTYMTVFLPVTFVSVSSIL